MEISCGLLIFNEREEILLCHVSGQNFHDIPKGGIDEGETEMQCVLRETLEETGLTFTPDQLIYVGLYKYNPTKKLHIYATVVDSNKIDMSMLKCTTYFTDRKTHVEMLEVDSYQWVSLDNVNDMCVPNMSKVIYLSTNKIKNGLGAET